MAALTLTRASYRDRILGALQGKNAGLTLGSPMRGRLAPGRLNFYDLIPGQPSSSPAMDFPLIWIEAMEQIGPNITSSELKSAWQSHLDYTQDEYGYAALNYRRGLSAPLSGAFSNWFHASTGGVMRADIWALIAPGNPQLAAVYAYHDASLDHSEEGVWAAMFLAAVGSASFFLTDNLTLLTIGLAMIPKTCRTARGIKAALAAAHRGAVWLEARESVLKEVGDKNFSDVAQNLGFLTIGLLYGFQDFGASLSSAVNCGYDTEAVGGAIGALMGIRLGSTALPQNWIQPLGDIALPGMGMRNLIEPIPLGELADRIVTIGEKTIIDRCPDVEIHDESEFMQNEVSKESFESSITEVVEIALPDSCNSIVDAVTVEKVEGEQTTSPESIDSAKIAESENVDPALTLDGGIQEKTPSPLDPEGQIDAWMEEHKKAAAKVTSSTAGQTINQSSENTTLLPQSVSPDSDAGQPVSEAFYQLLPQSVNEEPPLSISAPIAELVGNQMTSATDPTNAFAWADNTLVKPLLITPPFLAKVSSGFFEIELDTRDSPVIAYNQPKTLGITVINRGETAFNGRISLLTPTGWQASGPASFGQRQYISAKGGTMRAEYQIQVLEGQGRIELTNAVVLRLTPENGDPATDARLLLLGASCWWTVGPFPNMDGDGFDRSFLPEDRPGLQESYFGRGQQFVHWEKRTFSESVMDIEPLFKGTTGVIYGQTILRVPAGRTARLTTSTNTGVKVWLNDTMIFRRNQHGIFRPTLNDPAWTTDVSLNSGDNTLMIKWVRGIEPFQFCLTLCDSAGRALPDISATNW